MSHYLCRMSLLGLLFIAGCTTTEGTEHGKADELDKNTIVRLADRMRQQGDLPMAEQFYQRAISDDPKNAAAYNGLANVALAQNDFPAAARAYREALKYDEANPDTRRDYARLLLKQGKYDEAITQYRAALLQTPDDSKSRNGLGVALDQTGDHAAAQAEYRAVLDKQADDMSAINNLGLSLLMSGNYAGAVAVLAPAAESFKAPAGVRDNLRTAQTYLQSKSVNDAVEKTQNIPAITEVKDQVIAGESEVILAGVVPPPPAPDAIDVAPPTMPLPNEIVPVMAQIDSAATATDIALPTTTMPAATIAPLVTKPLQPIAKPIRVSIGPYATAQIAAAKQVDSEIALAQVLPTVPQWQQRVLLGKQQQPRFLLQLSGFTTPHNAEEFCSLATMRRLPCRVK